MFDDPVPFVFAMNVKEVIVAFVVPAVAKYGRFFGAIVILTTLPADAVPGEVVGG
jgi:hypothetical protein